MRVRGRQTAQLQGVSKTRRYRDFYFAGVNTLPIILSIHKSRLSETENLKILLYGGIVSFVRVLSLSLFISAQRSMRIRLRTPDGAHTLNLSDQAVVSDLLAAITEKTTLASFEIKYGYPPKPLVLGPNSTLLSALTVPLNGEQLTISAQDDVANSVSSRQVPVNPSDPLSKSQPVSLSNNATNPVPFAGLPSTTTPLKSSHTEPTGPISLTKSPMQGDVPEVAMPNRGATLVMRVMPDDNSCLFRAFGTAVLPGDDLSMLELRALVASTIQRESDTYSEVVLEQKPDDYCRWIQTEDAWGGAIEMTILSQHFDIEICSIDVQSLRIDRFNESASTKCILVYSGIHYDTLVQSPSESPHTRSDSPPEFDRRIWDHDDEEILVKARELCKKLQDKHYFTDTGGMTIKCNECGWIGYGEGQAAGHAGQFGHYDMGEIKQ